MSPFAPGFFSFRGTTYSEAFEGSLDATMFSTGAGATWQLTDAYSPGTDKELLVSPQSNAYPATLRLNTSPSIQNFDITWIQSQCSDNTDSSNSVWSGIVARTSYWGVPSGLGSYNQGLYCYLHRDGTLYLAYGTNSATAGGLTPIASVASGLGNYPGNAGNPNVRVMVTMRWKAAGNNHEVWVNGVSKIIASSSVYATVSSQLAFFTSPQAWTGLGSQHGYPALFDDLVLA